MFFAERVADLTRKMLRKKFYVVLSKPVGGRTNCSRSSRRISNT
jgi:hypothetical protein